MATSTKNLPIGGMSREQLLTEYRRLAKTINQRMVRLERLKEDQYYTGVLTYAYAGAKKAAERWGTSGEKPRFKESIKGMDNIDLNTLRARVSYLRTLEKSQTMTKGGIKKMYVDRTKSLNKAWGTDYTWQEIANFFDKGIVDINDMAYGSKTVMGASNVILRNKITPKNVDEKLKELKRDGNIDSVEEEVIKNLTSQGLNYKNLFG